jgi:hypothetical protein
VRQDGADDLRLIAETRGEQRADRAVDQAGGQNLLFRRAAFALEKAAGNLAGGESLFLVVDGRAGRNRSQLRGLLGDDGAQNGGLAIGDEDGASA